MTTPSLPEMGPWGWEKEKDVECSVYSLQIPYLLPSVFLAAGAWAGMEQDNRTEE